MEQIKGIKIKLNLNNKQKTLALRHCGAARFSWNWGVNFCLEKLKNNERIPNKNEIQKTFIREIKSKNPWLKDCSKHTPQKSVIDLDTAFSRYFRKISKIPKFKKRSKTDSFYIYGENIKTKGKNIKIPIFGWIRCYQALPNNKITSVVIKRSGEDWYISFKVKFIPDIKDKKESIVGIDLGIKVLATLSNGEVYFNKHPYRKAKRKLKIAQRKVSKKYKRGTNENQSKNYIKAVIKLNKIHQRVSNIRKDSLHKLTTNFTKTHSKIVIEDLNISGMVKNHKLASAILDVGFFEFRRQCEYKGKWYGCEITMVDQYFPSTKLCSKCGSKKDKMLLSERIYNCNVCGNSIDRDLNAAINLKNYTVGYTDYVCGVSYKQNNSNIIEDTMKQKIGLN